MTGERPSQARCGSPVGHVLYVASDVGRGHLMSAAVVRRLLLSGGCAVSVLTTSRGGQAFLEAITGQRPEVLRGRFGLVFGDAYDLRPGRTALGLARYVLSGRAAADVAQLRQAAETASAAVVINDGHPAPVLLRRLGRGRSRVALVNVLAENAVEAIGEAVAGWLPGAPGRLGRRLARDALVSGDQVIVNTLDPRRFFRAEGRVTFLPPIFQPACSPPGEVREHLGVGEGQPLFAAYLNPLFRRASILHGLAGTAARHGAFLYVVSEPFAALAPGPGSGDMRVVPSDPAFGDKIRAADLLVTGAGIAGPIQAYAYGTPLVVLVTAQPEHVENAAVIVESGMGVAARELADLPAAAARALGRQRQPHEDLLDGTADRWLAIVRRAAGAPEAPQK